MRPTRRRRAAAPAPSALSAVVTPRRSRLRRTARTPAAEGPPLLSVLELGCGHGLPGLWYLRQGLASVVAFCDFNAEARVRAATARHTARIPHSHRRARTFFLAPQVLECVTWPNTLLEARADERRAQFFAG